VLWQDCTKLAQQDRGILTLKSCNHSMPAAHAQFKPVVLNLFAKGRRIQTYDFVRELH